jgi:hypothetical protein
MLTVKPVRSILLVASETKLGSDLHPFNSIAVGGCLSRAVDEVPEA